MAVDTPARIAVLGAGPIGLEAALYARFLGYDVDVYERGDVAQHVVQWGHVRMFSPFGGNRSTLGLAALKAHDDQYQPPDDQSLLTGHQWARQYLRPLAETDLLVDAIHRRCEVLAVSRPGQLKTDVEPGSNRDETSFRILCRDADGGQRVAGADVVIDVTGVHGAPNPLGSGGIPALGEDRVRHRIQYGLPDVLGRDRERYAGRHTLVVGSGYSAATTIVALRQLADEAPGTRADWAMRRPRDLKTGGPIHRIKDDPLIERDRLAQQANRCVTAASPHITLLSAATVHAIQWNEAAAKFEVCLLGSAADPRSYDRVVCHAGFRPDRSLYRELQVDECYVTEAPRKLALWLRGQRFPGDPQLPAPPPDALLLPESDFYVLGSKSFGRNAGFLFSHGLQQIRQLFTIIGDRADLDLYASVKHLAR